jgi:hypothetical protein
VPRARRNPSGGSATAVWLLSAACPTPQTAACAAVSPSPSNLAAGITAVLSASAKHTTIAPMGKLPSGFVVAEHPRICWGGRECRDGQRDCRNSTHNKLLHFILLLLRKVQRNASCVLSGSSVRLAQHRRRAVARAFRLLVALLGGWDLLLCAKHLFAAARTRAVIHKGQGGEWAAADMSRVGASGEGYLGRWATNPRRGRSSAHTAAAGQGAGPLPGAAGTDGARRSAGLERSA